jgi:hypothetical protein
MDFSPGFDLIPQDIVKLTRESNQSLEKKAQKAT